jgi:hypothetical protein
MNCGVEWSDNRATDVVKEYILDELGCDVIGVELTDKQLESAIRKAQEYWLMWVGRVRSVDLTLTSAREYPASVLGPDVDSVVDVYFDAYDSSLKDIFGWADVEINPFQYVYEGRGGYSGLVQYMMYRDDAKKIVSADRDWQWDKSRRILVISPENSNTRKIKVVYLSRCFDYNYLSTYEWHLFKEYALMRAMKTLATIRMKYSDKPSATGTYTMDGETMYANAEAMEMRLEEKMRLMQHPVGIMTD